MYANLQNITCLLCVGVRKTPEHLLRSWIFRGFVASLSGHTKTQRKRKRTAPYAPYPLPMVSIVAPFWLKYILGILKRNTKKELQWRLQVTTLNPKPLNPLNPEPQNPKPPKSYRGPRRPAAAALRPEDGELLPSRFSVVAGQTKVSDSLSLSFRRS